MKYFKTPSLSRKWTFLLLLMVGFTFLQCGDKDQEFLDPFEFVNNDFDNIGQIPDIEDPDPAIAIPPQADIQVPEITDIIVTDITGARTPDDVTEDNKVILDELEEAVAALSPAQQTIIQEEVTRLSPARLESLLSDEQALSTAAAQAIAALFENPRIRALFPQVILPQPLPAPNERRREAMETGLNERVSTLVGPCANAARAAYNAAVDRIQQNRDAQLATINDNFSRRTQEANARAVTRTDETNARYNQLANEVLITAIGLLEAADAIEPLDAGLAQDIRLFAFVYVVAWREVIFTGRAFDLESIETARLTDIAAAENARSTATTELDESFNAAIKEANETLENALNACHNQGLGS